MINQSIWKEKGWDKSKELEDQAPRHQRASENAGERQRAPKSAGKNYQTGRNRARKIRLKSGERGSLFSAEAGSRIFFFNSFLFWFTVLPLLFPSS